MPGRSLALAHPMGSTLCAGKATSRRSGLNAPGLASCSVRVDPRLGTSLAASLPSGPQDRSGVAEATTCRSPPPPIREAAGTEEMLSWVLALEVFSQVRSRLECRLLSARAMMRPYS